jgi:plastocyanin
MLAGCGLSGPAYEPAPEDAAVVDMTTWLSFDPSTIEITAGDTIEWRNTSPFTHTVTFTSAEAGTAAVDSGPIGPGEVFRHSFLTAGAYRYVCKPHEGHDMRGTVIVQPKAS